MIGHVAARLAQMMQQKRGQWTDGQYASFACGNHLRLVPQQPVQFAGAVMRRQPQAGALPDRGLVSAQCLEVRGAARVLPAEHGRQRPAGHAVPGQHAGTLGGEPGRADPRGVDARLLEDFLNHGLQGVEYLGRRLLDFRAAVHLQGYGPAGVRQHPAMAIEDQGAGGMRALIDGKRQRFRHGYTFQPSRAVFATGLRDGSVRCSSRMTRCAVAR